MRVAILLAAGTSRRFGRRDKLLVRLGKGTLLDHALRVVAAAPVQRRIVAVGAGAGRSRAAIRRRLPGTAVVPVSDADEGIGASLRAAVKALRPVDREVLLFLADMPWLEAGLAARLVRSAGRAAVVRPRWKGLPGHPVLVRGKAVAALRAARGDSGLRATEQPVRFVPGTRRSVFDVDTSEALRRGRRLFGSP